MSDSTPPGAGSADFVRTDVNRDSLEPVPADVGGARLVHRAVCDDAAAAAFSASRGHPVYPVKLPSSSISFTVGELAPGQRTSNHRHAYESMIYVLEGAGHSIVEGERLDWQAGDALYVPPWSWHQHVAAAEARVRYLTGTNLPLLRSLGQTVLRQEE